MRISAGSWCERRGFLGGAGRYHCTAGVLRDTGARAVPGSVQAQVTAASVEGFLNCIRSSNGIVTGFFLKLSNDDS